MWIYIIIIAIFIFVVIYGFVLYNNFVKLDNKVNEAFSTLDVYLKKRWDLLPNIVEVVKEYTKHERDTLKEVAMLRRHIYDNMSSDEKIEMNGELSKAINKMMALSEAYPSIKADQNFKDLSKQLIKIEDDIANARKYYNGVIRIFNNKVEVFPNNLFASLFGYKPKAMFQANESERKVIKVEL